MDKQLVLRKLAVAVLATFGVSGTALAVDEVEPDQPITSSQLLKFIGDGSASTGSVSVNGAIGEFIASPDADFYSFDGKQGDAVTIQIACNPLVDTMLFLFDPDKTLVAEDDDGDPMACADPSSRNSLIKYTLLKSGVYTVGVTAYLVTLTSGGTYDSTDQQYSGPYNLIISGVSVPVVSLPPAPPPPPPVTQIDIRVRPASLGRTPINPKSNGTIPVLLLSSGEFNPMDIDQKSITFGATGTEVSLRKCNEAGDFNRDGRPDLICHFDNQASKFVPGDLMARVKGKTRNGKAFEGNGTLKATVVKRTKQ